MTAATLDITATQTRQPTLAAAAGRNLVAAGAIFGSANLFQWGVLSGALHMHPAMLSLSWPLAVTVFIVTVRRLRSRGGEPARRAASWSRWGIAAQIGASLLLAAVSARAGDWELMRWMSPIGLVFYAVAYLVALSRGGPKWLAGAALVALIGAGGVAVLVGSPEQYLAYAAGLFALVLAPGAALAASRTR